MIYAIADPHLSFAEGVEKPMDVFGAAWEHHEERLETAWKNCINDDDTVIVAGDISWGLKLEDALPDLDFLANLPGHKVIIKGNHDLWWISIGKLRKRYADNPKMSFIQNDCVFAGSTAICGSRGWICPGTEGFDEHDEKIYRRELMRLEASLKAADGAENIIAALHYPPTNDKKQASGFTELFEKYGVKKVIYGHLHGKDVWPKGIKGCYDGVEYKLVSLDYLDCKPVRLE